MDNSFINDETVQVINNEYDYSNIIPTLECVTYLIKYCDNIFNQFNNLIKEDEKRNEQYKLEYKNYNYKKSYSERFEVYIKEKSYNNITCKSFESFQSAVNNGSAKNVNGIDIYLDLDYGRGQGMNTDKHENSFTIIFKPYEIKFARKSNYSEENMNQIENSINEILKQFPAVNSIFCTK